MEKHFLKNIPYLDVFTSIISFFYTFLQPISLISQPLPHFYPPPINTHRQHFSAYIQIEKFPFSLIVYFLIKQDGKFSFALFYDFATFFFLFTM